MTDGTADDESKTADDAETPATEDSSSSDRDGPGGGPRRVVSEQSVDDILASLNDTTARATASERDAEPSTDDADDPAENTLSDAPGPSEPAGTSDEPDGAPEDPRPANADDLTARIETGDVTGADVRAAEAGEGRERTPDIDEIELSLDDLEETATEASSAPTSGDDGPLAGSFAERQRDDSTGDHSTGDDAETTTKPNDERSGLLERLKGLFSR